DRCLLRHFRLSSGQFLPLSLSFRSRKVTWQPPGDEAENATQQKEGKHGKTRCKAKHAHQHRGNEKRLRIAAKLAKDGLVGRSLIATLCDKHAGRERHNE